MSKEETFSESMYKAIAIISEICVTESKMEISPKLAVERIRKCMLEVINQDEFSKGYDISLKREIKELKKQLAELKAENFELVNKVDVLESEKENLMKTVEEGSEVVEENERLIAENERLLEANDSLSNKFDKDSDMQNKIDILTLNNEALQQQLKEKDDEIVLEKSKRESIQQTRDYWHDMYMLKYEDIAKQVCEKIREKSTISSGMFASAEELRKFKEFLDQIEKGEK